MTPAERQRRHRQRQQEGKRVYPLVLDELHVVEVGLASGTLSTLSADDPERQLEALQRIVEALRHA